LDASKAGQNEYVLSMKARARLSRAAGGSVLLERGYEYQSGAAPFIDWARWDGLGSVARTGYQSMAERIAEDVFQPVAGPAILIGPGQKHSMRKQTGGRKRTGGNGGNGEFSEGGTFQFV